MHIVDATRYEQVQEEISKIQSMENSSSNKSVSWIWTRPLSVIPSWLRNKFFVAFAAFAVWMLFFDEKDVFTMRHHRQELRELQQSKRYYTDQISKEKTELENLKNNPVILEKFAREKYYMKRDNEDLFLIPERQGN